MRLWPTTKPGKWRFVVRDCWFGGWRRALRIDGGSDLWVRNIVFELNQEGIVARAAELGWAFSNLRFFDCYGYHNSRSGMTFENLRGLQILGCYSLGTPVALSLQSCVGVTIGDAQILRNGDACREGLVLEDCQAVTVRGCAIDNRGVQKSRLSSALSVPCCLPQEVCVARGRRRSGGRDILPGGADQGNRRGPV